MPTAWHKLGSEPNVCEHMLNHFHVSIFLPSGKWAECQFLHLYKGSVTWVDKMGKKEFCCQILFQYLKTMATIVISQHIIKIITLAVRECINIKIFSLNLERAGIQRLKISAGLLCFCHLCYKEVQVSFIFNSACQLQLVSLPTVPELQLPHLYSFGLLYPSKKIKDVALANRITFSLLSP